MMILGLLWVSIAMFVAILAMVKYFTLRKDNSSELNDLKAGLVKLDEAQSRIGELVRGEFKSNREELSASVRGTRDELGSRLAEFQKSMVESMRLSQDAQKGQFETFANQLDTLTTRNDQKLEAIRKSVEERLQGVQKDSSAKLEEMRNTLDDKLSSVSRTTREELGQRFGEFKGSVTDSMKLSQDTQRTALETFSDQIKALTTMTDQKLERIRGVVEEKLQSIQKENTAKLEEMRQTVDEKLHSTLEKRLGDAFTQVSQRLEQVYKGLGEMKILASDVGNLQRVLTNVKARGVWGEMFIEKVLEEVLTPAQYEKNFKPRLDSGESVEYAIKLPGQGAEAVWIPVDAKFPKDDYDRLIDAQEKSDQALVEAAAKSLEARIKQQARDIHDKYIHPPRTTDFAILYLPVESLYAEILRRPGLTDELQSKYRVVISGPTTFGALLNSLRIGFRTLAIAERAAEVWNTLGSVKGEFRKFGDILDKTHKQIQTVGKTIEEASRKTRTIERKLKEVEELPGNERSNILELEGSEQDGGAPDAPSV